MNLEKLTFLYVKEGSTFSTGIYQTLLSVFNSTLISPIPHYYATSEVFYSPDKDAQLSVWTLIPTNLILSFCWKISPSQIVRGSNPERIPFTQFHIYVSKFVLNSFISSLYLLFTILNSTHLRGVLIAPFSGVNLFNSQPFRVSQEDDLET